VGKACPAENSAEGREADNLKVMIYSTEREKSNASE
jgi:hypothetical protein